MIHCKTPTNILSNIPYYQAEDYFFVCNFSKKRSGSLTLQNAAACSLGKHINNPPLNSQTRP